jgi:hypothetical protein
MSKWSIRIIRRKNKDGSEIFSMHEVFLDCNGVIGGWACSPCRLETDSLEDLKDYVNKINMALGQPVHDLGEWDDVAEDGAGK